MYWKKKRGWFSDDCVNYNLALYLRMYAVQYIVMTTRAHTISCYNFIYGKNTHKAHVQAFKQRETHTSHTQNMKVKKKTCWHTNWLFIFHCQTWKHLKDKEQAFNPEKWGTLHKRALATAEQIPGLLSKLPTGAKSSLQSESVKF